MKYTAEIIAEKSDDGYQIASARLWKGCRDCSSKLETMIEAVYPDTEAIRDAVYLLADNTETRVNLMIEALGNNANIQMF